MDTRRSIFLIPLMLSALVLSSCAGALIDDAHLETHHAQHFERCERVEAESEERVGFICPRGILAVERLGGAIDHATARERAILKLQKGLGILSERVHSGEQLVIERGEELHPLSISIFSSYLSSWNDDPIRGLVTTSMQRGDDRLFYSCFFDVPPGAIKRTTWTPP